MGHGLKVLSGKEVINILSTFGFSVHSQKGSHIKMKKFSLTQTETLLVPDRNPIPKGTLKAIFNQASKYISESKLREHFYTK